MSRSHSTKRVHAETCVKSSALEQGEQHGLIPVFGSGTCDESIHVVDRAKMILDSVPQEVCDLLGLYVFVSDDYKKWSVGPFPEDILGNMGYDAVCVRAPCRPPSRKRCRNDAFDLVGVESNPGPSKSKMAKAMVVYKAPSKAKKGRKRGGQKMAPMMPNENIGGGGYSTRRFTTSAGLGAGVATNRTLGASFVTAPAAEGFIVPRAHFGFAGPPQKLADYNSDRGVRVSGCGLFLFPVQAGSVTATAGFGGTATYWQTLSPASVDPRLGNIEKIFQFYALREVRFSYIPAVGATTNVQVAFGVAQDTELSVGAIPTPTQSQLLELDYSVLTPAWQVATFTYFHRGAKLWECYGSGAAEAADTKLQAAIGATLLGASTSVVYGQFYVEYVCDFYEPCPILSGAN